MDEDNLLCARGEIPPNRCETCDFCTMILEKEGTVVCNVMGFDCNMPWSPSKVNRIGGPFIFTETDRINTNEMPEDVAFFSDSIDFV